jgi:EpsI family protein
VLAVGALAALTVPNRAEAIPTRASFVDFPMVLGSWFGERKGMDAEVMKVLKLNDYLIADYRGPAPRAVNLYVAWYDSQRAGRSVHSPRTCLPGGGWQIVEFDQVEVPGVVAAGQPLRVNRVVMGMGTSRQLVYYWFQQRGRIITNEYLAKWYLFWDSLTNNRSDGAGAAGGAARRRRADLERRHGPGAVRGGIGAGARAVRAAIASGARPE